MESAPVFLTPQEPFNIRWGTFCLLTFVSELCRPIARPSNTEWSERERKSMKERKGEWAWKSTWTWWPLLSRSGLVPWLWPWPSPFLLSPIRGVLSSWALLISRQFRTILSSMRTMKKPAAMMNSGRGKLVCFRPTQRGWWTCRLCLIKSGIREQRL